MPRSMLRSRMTLIALLWSLTTSLPVAAQTPPVSPVAPPVASELQPAPERVPAPGAEAPGDQENWGREVLRIGQDYTLMPGDATGQVVVLAGNATIEGRVERDVVVVLGRLRLASTGSINGSLVVIGGGSATIASGARVGRDMVVVGGRLDAPAQFTTGGQQIVIGPAVGGALEGVLPWMSRGLIWGRPIVPDLPWVWGIVGIFFIVYLVVSLVFHHPVRASAETLAGRPLTAFVVGLLVLLLTGPVCLLLAVSIIGIAVVPFVLCAILLAWILGKVGVVQWIGMGACAGVETAACSRLRSYVIGFALISLAYMVPLLGLVAWTTVGVFGLGGATRRSSPRPPGESAIRAACPTVVSRRRASPDGGAAMATAVAAEPAFGPSVASGPPPIVSDVGSLPHAAFRERLAAFVLDVILVMFVQHLLELDRRDSSVFLLLLAYHIGFWTWKSTTVGGIICQLRVIRVDGSRVGFADALVRGLSSIFSLAVVGLGALWILKDPERQAWHDKIAGTYVVKVPRNWPL